MLPPTHDVPPPTMYNDTKKIEDAPPQPPPPPPLCQWTKICNELESI